MYVSLLILQISLVTTGRAAMTAADIEPLLPVCSSTRLAADDTAAGSLSGAISEIFVLISVEDADGDHALCV